MKRLLLALGLLVALAVFLLWWLWPPTDITPSIETAWRETVPSLSDTPLVSPTREKLEGFIGVLERQAAVEVPQWWRDALMDARWQQGGIFYPPHVKGFDYKETGEHFKTPVGTTLERNGDKFILRTGEDSIALPSGVVGTCTQGSEVPNDFYSALFTPTRCYLAAHMDLAHDIPLFCIDRSSGKLLWKKEIEWRAGDGSYVNTRVWVSIVEQSNRVFVFCLGSHNGVHVEGCHPANGQSFLKFSGDWWGKSFKGFSR